MSSQAILTATPGQTVGPFFGYALPYPRRRELVPPGHPRRDPPARHGVRRSRPAGPRRAHRDLAGRPARQGAPAPGLAAPRRLDVHRASAGLPLDAAGRYSFTTVEPGPTEDGAPPSSR